MLLFMRHTICLYFLLFFLFFFFKKTYNGGISVFFHSFLWQNDSPVGRIKLLNRGLDGFIVLVSTVPSASCREIENLSDGALCRFYTLQATLAGFTVRSLRCLPLTEFYFADIQGQSVSALDYTVQLLECAQWVLISAEHYVYSPLLATKKLKSAGQTHVKTDLPLVRNVTVTSKTKKNHSNFLS